MQKVDLSLILPCYNEGPTFFESVSKIVSVLKTTKYRWEVIFVEDKSTDNTRISVEKIVKKIPQSRAIFHKENVGRGKSVSEGIMESKGKICGFLDVDLEVSESYIPLFISEVEKGADVVVGKRFYDKGSFLRFISSKVYALIVRMLLNLPVSDSEAGYKFFRRKSIRTILPKVLDKKWFWDTEICARAHAAGLKVTEIPVLFVRRPEKKSTVRLFPDTLDYLKAIIKFKMQSK